MNRLSVNKTKAEFRLYLNLIYSFGQLYRNGKYHQKTRGYGDYLYYQDRDKFNMEYEQWKNQPSTGHSPQ